MDTSTEIDFASVGIIVAYDKETGEVLHVHEKIVEVTNGEYHCGDHITQEERDEILDEVATRESSRKVSIIEGSSDMGIAQEKPVRYRIDLETQTLHLAPLESTE